MTVYAAIWGVLALVLITLSIYRKLKTREEDDSVHVSSGNWNVVAKQESMARSIAQLDRWGMILTIVTVVYGLALVGFFIFNAFQQSQRIVY